MTGTTDIPQAKKLDARSGDGIDVQLLWYPATNTVTISVHGASRDHSSVRGRAAQALDAFYHPSLCVVSAHPVRRADAGARPEAARRAEALNRSKTKSAAAS